MAQKRFFRRGKSELFFCPTVANLTAPTSAEITAGVPLTPGVQAISGFQLENAPITTPDLETTFDSQIDGPDTTATSTITFYDDDTTPGPDPIRAALAKGTDGFVVMCPYGNTSGKRAEVWPVRSTGVNDTWDLGATAALYVVGFAITGDPEQNAALSA